MKSLHHTYIPTLALFTALTFIGACGDGDEDEVTLSDAEIQAVTTQYAKIVSSSYELSLTKTKTMQADINAFIQTPSAAGMDKAKASWLAARDVYGQTEVYRFYDGPIDGEYKGVEGPEGKINAWPMDENYVDYTEGKPDAGLINDPAITLTREAIVAQNEKDGEKNISTGYHAVEFLLWGQDLSETGPGARPYTDFVDEGTAANQDRRRQYLQLVTEELVDDLGYLQTQWAADKADNFRAEFVASSPREALTKMINGMGNLSGAELAGERMEVALENRDQEDEHSCFSDNTHNDIIANAQGIENVYLGSFNGADGPGIDELVQKLDPALNTQLKAELAKSVELAKQIPVPFDQALKSEDGRAKIEATIQALRAQTKTIAKVAALLDVTINLEE